MTRSGSRAIAVAACSIAAVVLLGNALPNRHDGQEHVRNTYIRGPREVTVKTREGTTLSVLQMPADVEFSIHVLRESGAAELGVKGGDVVIRVLPANRLKDGPLLPQMMQAPFELSLADVDVSVR